MGGTTFRSTGKAKTVSEAFVIAQDRDRHEFGSGGYTGSLAEKPGYVEWVGLPADVTIDMIEAAFNAMDWDDAGNPVPPEIRRTVTYRRPVTIKTTEKRHQEVPMGQDAPAEPPAGWRAFETPHDPEIVEAGEWVVTEQEPHAYAIQGAEAAKVIMKLPRWREFFNVYNDKWESALAVKTGTDEWTFFGFASC
jgi:hypothetical protein